MSHPAPASRNPRLIRTDLDSTLWDEELEGFVPARVFDAHTHIFDSRDWKRYDGKDLEGVWREWPLSDWANLGAVDALLFPGRTVHRLAFGNPMLNQPLAQANAFTAQEVSNDPASAALALVHPALSLAELDRWLGADGFLGVKPYRVHSVTGDPVECRIRDFLPEDQLSVLNRHGGLVMLHMAKRAAVADEDNLADLERYATAFPRVQWILAHCARSYYDRPLRKAADRLRALPNLWYEISSVCDADAMDALLEIGGPDRVMYGSDDIPVGVLRGKYITFGFSWACLKETNHQFDLSHCDGRMTFTRYESLLAFRRACRRHGYGKAEFQRLFYDNAAGLIASIREERQGQSAGRGALTPGARDEQE